MHIQTVGLLLFLHVARRSEGLLKVQRGAFLFPRVYTEQACASACPLTWCFRKLKAGKPSAKKLLSQAGCLPEEFQTVPYGGIGSTELSHAVPPLDSLFVGKYSVHWTIRDFRRKWSWRQRHDRAPPLRTSRFPFAGLNMVQIRFWPAGNQCGKPGFVSLGVNIPECWRNLHYPVNLFVDSVKKGPFRLHSPEYFQVANSFCRLEDLDLRENEITLGFEVAPKLFSNPGENKCN
ncbi:hypothetical protein CSUI_002496 [Cystoisospora suis]|uniref:Uncharacterized protein n=1 Tax=Cystoisospora suis TaxID=483139 RepID=A0A2C6L8L4_9APIC|nr:hypothetical protein CSUI_002496 [Cystoisospora suis]